MLLIRASFIFLLIEILTLAESGKPLMCYIAAYAIYRPKPAKFTANEIDPHLCTHLIYAHLGLSKDEPVIAYTDAYADLPINGGFGLIEKVAAIKERNPSLKVLFSLGGWNEGSVKFSKIAASQDKRVALAKNLADTIKKHNFDGIDINWMYPYHRGGKAEDVANYVLLLKEIRKELKRHGYILVSLMSGNEYIYTKAYDLKGMAEHLDYILLLSYDYHGFWDGKTGVFAPMKYSDTLSVTKSVEKYLESGIESSKILLGFGASGRTFISQQDFTDTFFGVPAKEAFSTSWTKEKGFIGFNEICHEFKMNDLWTKYWDTHSSTPFATSGRKLISYENEKSYEIKLNYLKSKNLGGAMVWSLDTDDFTGDCFDKPFYLTKIIKDALQSTVGDIEKISSTETSVGSTCDHFQCKLSQESAENKDEINKKPIKIISVVLLNIIYN